MIITYIYLNFKHTTGHTSTHLCLVCIYQEIIMFEIMFIHIKIYQLLIKIFLSFLTNLIIKSIIIKLN